MGVRSWSRWSAAAFLQFLGTAVAVAASEGAASSELPLLNTATTTSPLDGETQQILWWAPDTAATEARPLFVFLHSWSSDYRQDNSKWLREAVRRDWIYLHPDFRGVNQSPKACGSRFARQDILDAVHWARENLKVDPNRVYLAGVSGGGHMAMLMAGHHPEAFSAVSAWVGISDLAAWHAFHTDREKPSRYARMIEQSLGGPPGADAARDAEYRDRSPRFHLHRSGDLPVSIYAGVNDGHTGSVPVSHALEAYNAIARGHQSEQISRTEIEQLVTQRQLQHPREGDVGIDEQLGRDIFLRRSSGDSIVIIFAGGHESIPAAACNRLEEFERTALLAE